MFDTRLIGAEILKLRRRHGLLAVTAFLTFGTVAVYYAVVIALHALDADRSAAGGLDGFHDAMGALAMAAGVAGVLVGATAGGADIETGVFRDLVATGRSRTALMLARVPGAWAVVSLPIGAGIALAALLATVLDGATAAPTAGQALEGAVAAMVSGLLLATASVGLAALTGSRGMVIGVALAFQLGISPLLAEIDALGNARAAIPQVAVARIGGADIEYLALATAIAVVLAWALAALAAGLWRTRTQEI